MEYTEYNNMKRIEELETAVRVLSQDLAHAGAQISELIRMYSQLDAKLMVKRESDILWNEG